MSAQHDGVLWVHNDSGDSARFFALGLDGSDLGTWSIDATIKDWEDLALGYDATRDADVLYIGDVGDNAKSRDYVTIFIVVEPEVDVNAAPTTTALDSFDAMRLTYPDGASHNCETLMHDPQTGDLYLVTKSGDGQSPVFRKPAPHIDGSETEVQWVAGLQFGQAPLSGSASTTAGAFSPSGDRLLIRTYTDAWLWHREAGQSMAETLSGDACDVEAPNETQGEAICFTTDGQGYLTISEGLSRPVYFTPLD